MKYVLGRTVARQRYADNEEMTDAERTAAAEADLQTELAAIRAATLNPPDV